MIVENEDEFKSIQVSVQSEINNSRAQQNEIIMHD